MKYLFFILSILLGSCQTQKSNAGTAEACFGFDQRQCDVDDFAAFIQSNSQEDLFSGISTYLSNQNIDIQHIRIDMDFHENVCEACEICPKHHRFFVSIPNGDVPKLEALQLFNLVSVSCADYF